MNTFTKRNLKEIPIEEAHGGRGSRQLLFTQSHLNGNSLDAITKGFLPANSVFDWHNHIDIDEMFIVLKGKGKFYCEKEETDYAEGDVFSTPANLSHKIEATEDSEFYFIRVK